MQVRRDFFKVGVLALLLVAGSGVESPAAPRNLVAAALAKGGLDLRDIAGEAKISLKDAIASALKVRSGRALVAELASRVVEGKRTVFFEVKVVTDAGELFKVRVDPRTGEANDPTREEPQEARREIRGYQKTLRDSELSLSELVAKAEEIVRGAAVTAALEEGRRFRVRFVSSGYLVDVSLEGRSGELVELELAEGEHGEQIRDEDEGEEDADDEEEIERGREDEDAEEEEEDQDGREGDVNDGGSQRTKARSAENPKAGPTLTPIKDGVVFSPRITHPYYPLSTARYTELHAEDEKVVREVLEQTETLSGVECLVLAEKEYEDAELKEISYNFFAQDPEGNVYYFGENVDDYKDGRVVGHGGAWRVGKNATEPCLFMPARLEVGFQFKPENSPPAAEEWDEIEATDVRLSVPAGTYQNVLVVKESNHPDRWEEKKFYARGVGLISENRELNLAVVKTSEEPKKIR